MMGCKGSKVWVLTLVSHITPVLLSLLLQGTEMGLTEHKRHTDM